MRLSVVSQTCLFQGTPHYHKELHKEIHKQKPCPEMGCVVRRGHIADMAQAAGNDTLQPWKSAIIIYCQ